MRFLAFCLFFPSLAFAGEWTPADTVRQGVVTGFLMADWAQTRYIAQNPKNCIEVNNILGEHPSTGKVNNYFAASIIGHAAISYILPRPWREGWQYVWIGIEAKTVQKNHSIGIKMNF